MADTPATANEGEDGDGPPGLLRDLLGEWRLWALVVVSALMVLYTVRNPSITPRGYKAFFGLSAGILAVYAVHRLEHAPDLV